MCLSRLAALAIWHCCRVRLRVWGDRTASADHRHTWVTPNRGRAATSAMSAKLAPCGGLGGSVKRRGAPDLRRVGASGHGTMAHTHCRPRQHCSILHATFSPIAGAFVVPYPSAKCNVGHAGSVASGIPALAGGVQRGLSSFGACPSHAGLGRRAWVTMLHWCSAALAGFAMFACNTR